MATITQPATALTASISAQTNVSCNGGSNGSATVTASGGTIAYTYLWSNAATTATINNLIAGAYTVTVTDHNGCTATAVAIITQPAALSASISSQTNVSCNGGSNGSATVTATGGTIAYTYLWSNSATTATINNLFAGAYTVTVTDHNGCTSTAVATITQPAALSASISSQTNVNCNGGGNNGSATVTASGGTIAYTYLWSNSATTATINNLAAGAYTITVTDHNGCTATTIATITQPTTLSASISSQTNVSCNGFSNGSATVTASGGTIAYTYLWSNSATTATINNLAAGVYTATVTDYNGCTATALATIIQPVVLSVSISAQTNVSCNGSGSNGSVTVTASGGTLAYTYLWSNSATTATINNLAAGAYTVTVTDANSCSATVIATIIQPTTLSASISNQTNINCNGGSNGSATVTASGGTIAYTYLWSNSATTSTINNLVAGAYTVTVTDHNGCTATALATIIQPAILSATISSQSNESCNGDINGSATVTASGGTIAYTYLWSNNANTATINNLAIGVYNVTVTDANSCSASTTLTITQPAVLNASISSQININCAGVAFGSATVSASGGTTAYTYAWSTSPVQTTATVTGLNALTYTTTVTDANSCSATTTVTITQPTDFTIAFSQTNVSCNGGSNGSATITPSGGSLPYTYLWNTSQTTATITGLSQGSYIATITDASSCFKIVTINITQPNVLVATLGSQTNVGCKGDKSGTATMAPTGGTPAYSYLWSTIPAQATATATGLAQGTYSVTVTDANSCSASTTVTITQPLIALAVSISSQTNVGCNGDSTGSIKVIALGGTSPYTYSWSTIPVQATATATGLAQGTYTVTVTDANACTKTTSATITQPNALSATINSKTNVSCNGGSNGSATVSASGGTPAYTYSWNTLPVQTTATATGLTQGSYTVTVTDANACTKTTTVTITQPTLLTASISSQTNLICNGNTNGSATVSTFGGTPSYTYSWNTSVVQITATATGLSAGNYTVTVSDANSCSVTTSVTITQPAAISTNIASTTNPICNGGCTNLTDNVSGGTIPYSYLWNNLPAGTSSIINVCPLNTTTYTVTTTDLNGCSNTTSLTVNVINTSIIATPTSICLGGSSTLTATGGGNSYQWSSGGTTSSIVVSPTTTTSYTVTVINGGCTNTAATTISVGSLIIDATATPNPICLGDSAMIVVTGGITYQWSNPPGGTSDTIYVKPITTTTYTVTGTNACTAQTSVTVNVNSPKAASINAFPQFICNSGSSVLTASAGASWVWNTTPPQFTQQITVTPVSTTTYCVTVTDSNGCTASACTTIIVNSVPVALVTPSATSICAGDNATLIAGGGTSFQWNNGSTKDTIVVSPATSTFYCVTVSNNGCSASTCANVTVVPLPTANISVSDNPICQGQTSTLTASGGANYSWSSPPGGTTSIITVSPATTTNYTVTVTQNGCSASATANTTLTVNPTPVVTVTSSNPSNIICSGDCVTFTASGAPIYTFYINGNIVQGPGGYNIFTSCALNNNDVITVLGSTPAGCSSTSAPITMTVHPTPSTTLALTPPSSCGVCDGVVSETTIGGTLPYSPIWNNAQATTTISNLCSGIYVVTVTDANGCSANALGSISDPSSPVVTLTSSIPNDTICSGTCVTFTASGALNYQYFINGVSQGPPNNDSTLTSCTLNNGDVITVKGTNASNCADFASITFVVYQMPIAFNVTGGGPYCIGTSGSTVCLNSSQNNTLYTLLYNGINTGITIIGNNAAICFPPVTGVGTYCVIAQNAFSTCQDTMAGCVPVTANQPPAQFTLNGGGAYCSGGAGVLVWLSNSEIGVNYQLLINSVPSIIVAGTGSPLQFGNQTVAGNYCVIAINALTACQNNMLNCVTVTVNPLPKAYALTGGGSYCAGGMGVPICLSGSDSLISYQLVCTPPASAQAVIIGPALCFGNQTLQGNYTAIATDSNGCKIQMIGNVNVVVNANPIADAGIDQTICQWSSTTLNGNGAGVGGSYVWTNNSINNNILQNPTVNPLNTSTYSLTVTDVNGCTGVDGMILNVLPFTLPVITASDTGFCDSSKVNSILDAGNYASYLWSTTETTETITVNSSDWYTVFVTATDGCTASDSMHIIVYPPIPPPIILADGLTHFCQPDTVVLFLNNPYYTYQWSSGSINAPTIIVTESNDYYVTVTDSFGCVAKAGPLHVTVDPLPKAIIGYTDHDNPALTFDFYSYSLNATTWNWNFGDAASLHNTSAVADTSHNFSAIGTYTVTLIVTNNCGSDTAKEIIGVHHYSGINENNGFTDVSFYPNPTNDFFNIDFKLNRTEQLSLVINNALGQLIYNENLSLEKGKYHKQIDLTNLPAGIYFLRIDTDDGTYNEKIIKN